MRVLEAACLALGLGLAANASGDPRPVRILFDEAHHNVQTSEGSFRPLVELLSGAGFEVQANSSTFSASILESYEVLLIPVARSAGREASMEDRFRPAFTESEVDSVYDWVARGGGLLLFTDHHPAGQAAQPLADRLGVEMSNGFTGDAAQGGGERAEDWAPYGFDLLFSRENRSLAVHPITDGLGTDLRVERVVTFLGQSLEGPVGSTSILRLSSTAVDWYLRWSGRSWEPPEPGRDRVVSAAGRSQALAFEIGRGRVVVLGEAGLFTKKGIRAAGEESRMGPADNATFAVNIVRWLARLPK